MLVGRPVVHGVFIRGPKGLGIAWVVIRVWITRLPTMGRVSWLMGRCVGGRVLPMGGGTVETVRVSTHIKGMYIRGEMVRRMREMAGRMIGIGRRGNRGP